MLVMIGKYTVIPGFLIRISPGSRPSQAGNFGENRKNTPATTRIAPTTMIHLAVCSEICTFGREFAPIFNRMAQIYPNSP